MINYWPISGTPPATGGFHGGIKDDGNYSIRQAKRMLHENHLMAAACHCRHAKRSLKKTKGSSGRQGACFYVPRACSCRGPVCPQGFISMCPGLPLGTLKIPYDGFRLDALPIWNICFAFGFLPVQKPTRGRF